MTKFEPDEFATLDPLRKTIMAYNMPGCGDVISTHGMLCVRHDIELNE